MKLLSSVIARASNNAATSRIQRRAASAVLALGGLAACAGTTPSEEAAFQAGERITDIYWSDGDSGVANGKAFRLADIDAPETGGVGAAVGGAACEAERERGFAVKAAVVEATRPDEVRLTVAAVTGESTYERAVIDLAVDGRALTEFGLARGFYKPWPHDGGRALAPKPDWCRPD